MLKLPPDGTLHWGTKMKALVVRAIRSGEIAAQEAMSRYSLSEDELNSWIKRLDTFGRQGLRVTRLKDYRMPESQVFLIKSWHPKSLSLTCSASLAYS